MMILFGFVCLGLEDIFKTFALSFLMIVINSSCLMKPRSFNQLNPDLLIHGRVRLRLGSSTVLYVDGEGVSQVAGRWSYRSHNVQTFWNLLSHLTIF